MEVDPAEPVIVEEEEEKLDFIVHHQKVELDIDFTTRTLKGRTEITILPTQKDLKKLRFNARQCDVPWDGVTVNNILASVTSENSYMRIDVPETVLWTVEQYDMQKERIAPLLSVKPTPGELFVGLPKSVRVKEVDVDPFSEEAPNAVRERALNGLSSRASNAFGSASTPVVTPRGAEDGRYSQIVVSITFSAGNIRDGLHFVGIEEGDHRYPHVYSRHSVIPGTASCIFPCIDDPSMRCTWDLSIKCGKTLGDAMKTKVASDDVVELNPEDKLLEMQVLCSGDQTNEIVDPNDASKKIVSFQCGNQIAAHLIGFVIGPFEQVDLSDFRAPADDDKLGQKAIQVFGYCLPGRSDELRHSCESLPGAVDWFSLTYGSYPFTDYKVCFVEDQVVDTQPLPSLSLCSTRLIFTEDILDPEVENTRKLVHALASQWIGVGIVPQNRCDMWVPVGVSHFITDLFMKELCGNNEYRFRQKTLQDKLVDLDMQRPSLYALGETLHLGSFEMEFMELKAPLILFILDNRLRKASGSTGLQRIISRLFIGASTSESLQDSTVSTESFRRLCEKVGHYKVDSFFNQYVLGAGFPRIVVAQKFNKKRLSVEMTISQKQNTLPTQRPMEKGAFLREFKEETNGVYAGDVQSFFTGPMTIRIHEADGTPYEHIVEIREEVQKLEIPYHTKYKRLKRSRREKERAVAGVGADISADNENDVLLYCLGDVLQTPEEVREWGLTDWSEEQEQKMDQESYEWIRMDADFEWICTMEINMPSYMYVSQLQQDRDIVAQQDSMLYLSKVAAHPLVSTILVRTLMDRRYFHGIRTMATDSLSSHATENTNWIGRRHLEKAFQHFFCHADSQSMPRSNDFSDKKSYLIQCAIPRAMAKIRNNSGQCPKEARQFILDQLTFNDNRNNEYSDHFYIANLMTALTQSLLPKPLQPGEIRFDDEDEERKEELKKFQKAAVTEIDRYRRMDEWDPSYQNIYTTTALGCKARLMKAKIIPVNGKDFLVYAHYKALDLVRIKAFASLVEVGCFSSGKFLRYFLRMMSSDSSPFVRERMFQTFGIGLARIAFGEHNTADEDVSMDDGLVVEDDLNLESKNAHKIRTTTIEGALAALKDELRDNVDLKKGIWDAVRSKTIGLGEQSDLLDICFVLYESKESMIIRIPYPRYWKVERREKGHLIFKQTKKIRTVRREKFKSKAQLIAEAAEAAAAAKPAQPVRLAPPVHLAQPSSSLMKPPKRPLPVDKPEIAVAASPAAGRPRKMVKLSIPNGQLAKFPPGRSIAKHRKAISPMPPTARPSISPGPAISLGSSANGSVPPVSPQAGSSGTVSPALKVRVPLPTGARKPLPDGKSTSPEVARAPLPDGKPPLEKKPSFKLKLNFAKRD